MTNYEKYFGTPEKAAKTIQTARRVDGVKRCDFEPRYFDWLAVVFAQTPIDRMSNNEQLMCMFLQEECDEQKQEAAH